MPSTLDKEKVLPSTLDKEKVYMPSTLDKEKVICLVHWIKKRLYA